MMNSNNEPNNMKNDEDMMSDITTPNTTNSNIVSIGGLNNNPPVVILPNNTVSTGVGTTNNNITTLPPQLKVIPINLQSAPVIPYPSLPNIAPVNSSTSGTASSGGVANRFNPYTAGAGASLSFQEKWDIVEQVVLMFPLLEKDPIVYSTLQKNNWVIDSCVNEFQKRHEVLEERSKRKENKYKTLTEPLLKQKLTESSEMKDLDEDEDDVLDDENIDGSILDKLDNEILDDNDLEEDEEILDEKESSSQDMMDSNQTSPYKPGRIGPNNSSYGQSALSFSRFPNIKEHIQTLRDIFGNAYHEYELKSFYVACNGNLELVIDQIVNDQIKANSVKPSDPTHQNKVDDTTSSQEKKTISERLSEEDKRTIQMQLIEEQEKLEKKFSEQKKNETKNHPSKKNFSQQEIINELKDLFGKSVDHGVIEWVAYRCDYDLGSAVTQLVDIKHNSLNQKGTTTPNIDQNTQNMISHNLEILAKQNLASAGINLDSFADEISKKLTADDTPNNQINNNNSGNVPKNIFFNGLTPSTTTTTTTTSNNNVKSNDNNSINPFFQSTFNYNSKH